MRLGQSMEKLSIKCNRCSRWGWRESYCGWRQGPLCQCTRVNICGARRLRHTRSNYKSCQALHLTLLFVGRPSSTPPSRHNERASRKTKSPTPASTLFLTLRPRDELRWRERENTWPNLCAHRLHTYLVLINSADYLSSLLERTF